MPRPTASPHPLAVAALAGALAAATACGDGASGPAGPELAVAVAGRVERGSVVTLTTTLAGAAVPASAVTWTVSPALAADVAADGTARLKAAGRVTVIGTAQGAADTVTLDVAVPPTIVFDRYAGGNRDIYRAALDGQDLVPLTTNAADDRTPSVARDTVVFVSYRDGNGELYAVPLAGGAERRLTTTSAREASPSLSPAGPRLAFTTDLGGTDRLWIAAADGSAAAAVANQTFEIHVDPRWAPTGDALVFVSTALGPATLFTLNPATGAVAPLPVGPGPNVEPAWSRDGRFIVFASVRGGQQGLYRYDVAGGAVTLLATGRYGQPSVLRDGRVVFTESTAQGPRLRWLDPAAPTVIHAIDTGAGEAEHAVSP